MVKNLDIREKARLSNVKLWQIATRLGVHDSNFSRMLRKELSREEKGKIFQIIDEIQNENELLKKAQ